MTFSAVLSRSWELYRRFFAQLVLTAIPVFVVLGLLDAIVSSLGDDDSALALVFWGIVSLGVAIIGYFWLQGALVEVVADIRDGRADFSVGEIYERVRPRLAALIAAGLVVGLGILVGLILLIIPGLFLLTRWSLIAPAIVLERRSAGESMSRSWELVKGHSWTMFGIIVVTAILAGIASGIISALFVFLPDFLGTWVGSVVANSLTAPFVVLAWTNAYFALAGEPAPREELAAPTV
ncbi:MAG: glycerophosphoryl diester phosphodiesterase membrane domain-containing protein [Pseudomonadota bacterium]